MKLSKNKYRAIIYVAGLLILAMGLTLNTKAGLGVSPIISIAYSASVITGYNFGNTTLVLYSLFVVIEIILHVVRGRRFARTNRVELRHAQKVDARLVLLMDLLQIPLSIVFTRFLNIFSVLFPDIDGEGKNSVFIFCVRLIVLLIALILTGIGAAMSLNMRIVPNPGDGIVQAIADVTHKSVGLIKNCVDVSCVIFAVIISIKCTGKLQGVGIGTIIAMVAVGRIIAIFNKFTKEKLTNIAGIED